ncbi:AGL164Wp [Eremothecium gossypii ATCC 10895]|uniref:Diphthine--ammonia ligase n=1 Tax=Eremothecium gossypii (strain ATCC 10895 / CBS 109.51 / FGSC 9923 / NRRL Y-1056) TaxID=284811 RepID=Q750V3_EREGS|nr:AGL164Wp [Eremothecium gossypii ATCC 10895]AAS54327.1 AGL164Wp [Eremothecium gossypii ATCC 10895]
MKFVALVSGGKDSCYNILHCMKNGHELVAFANLHPKEENVQELDSFMFQTVGHEIVSYYGKCTGLPVFRQAIARDTSKNVALNYFATAGDEVEDLYLLLKRVKDSNLGVEAVSVGAILSSYQRTRVEDVCSRLGLTALSYLWERDQEDLMREMCSMSKKPGDAPVAKLDARIIKVAAIGLNQNHLGLSLPEIFPTLLSLNRRYGVHICGEGGEFETMVLDAPFFTKGYLEIVGLRTTVERGSGVCTAALDIQFVARHLEGTTGADLANLPVPKLENKWEEIYHDLEPTKFGDIPSSIHSSAETGVSLSENTVGGLLYVSNIQPRCRGPLEKQARDVFDQLNESLTRHGVVKAQVLSSVLLLADMGTFAEINTAYNGYFSIQEIGPLPPSRACIESKSLAPGIGLQLSVVIQHDIKIVPCANLLLNPGKGGLHVQSRSYWCPCNIGPYSQATWDTTDRNKVAYISGQIALLPNTMEMCNTLTGTSGNPYQEGLSQAILALRHFNTLKKSIETCHQLFMCCYIAEDFMAPIASSVWSSYCSSNPDNTLGTLLIVRVSALPRSALCEWGGSACQRLLVEDDDDDYSDELPEQCSDTLPSMALNYEAFLDVNVMTVRAKNQVRHYLTGFLDTQGDVKKVLDSCVQCQITLYYVPSPEVTLPTASNVEYVPVNAIYDSTARIRNYALQIKY